MSHVRIEETHDICGPHTRVVFVADDGTETDISHVTRAVSYVGKIGEANRATVELIKVRGSVKAPLVEVVVSEMTPRKPRWWRHLRKIEVSTFEPSGSRSYING